MEDQPIEPPDPCVGVECKDGWVCSPADLPDCHISILRQEYCDPTPVCLPAPKVGECPIHLNEEMEARKCDNLVCFQDDNCPGDEKCCPTDFCGKICVDPTGVKSSWMDFFF